MSYGVLRHGAHSLLQGVCEDESGWALLGRVARWPTRAKLNQVLMLIVLLSPSSHCRRRNRNLRSVVEDLLTKALAVTCLSVHMLGH
jgi:hypothetical protein